MISYNLTTPKIYFKQGPKILIFFCQIGLKYRKIVFKYILRATVCKYREFAVKTEISKFFILGQKKPFGKTFSKTTIKVSKKISFWRN